MKNAIRTIATVALAFALVGCSPTSTKTSGEDKTIKVGATAVPHAEILNNVVKDVLAKRWLDIRSDRIYRLRYTKYSFGRRFS